MKSSVFFRVSVVCLVAAASTRSQCFVGSRNFADPQETVEAETSPVFTMNRGAVFSEDETTAKVLSDSLSGLIDALRRGEITDQHISEQDQQRHSFFMGALRRLEVDPGVPGMLPLVLKSFSPDGGESFLISVAFMSLSESGSEIEKIIEFHAYPYNGRYRFRSPFDYRTRTLETAEVDSVRYHFDDSFNRERAEEFAGFKRGFERRVGNPSIGLEYYRFGTLDELLRAYGIVYDCTRCNWLKEDLGFMDNDGRFFVTGTGNERFIFGYLVDYMSRYCDGNEDLYPPFVYGMAAYYGGYGLSGDTMEILKAQFRDELAERPEIDFFEEFRKGRRSSVSRHFSYFVICAFLCEEALDRHGFDTMMTLARSGRSDDGFFESLDSLLGINENNFHETVARLIQEES